MLNLKPYSSSVLAFGGFLISLMGFYFVLLRPALLTEDYVYIGTTSSIIKNNFPQFPVWLQKVFWVIGGYIFATGLLTIFIALTSFRMRAHGAFSIIVISGTSSIGFMTIVNFMIVSDFKWMLFTFSLLWIVALVLYQFRK